MNIGVVGSDRIADVIRKIEKEGLSGIRLIYRCCNDLEPTPDLVHALQEQGNVDAILFTGPTNYEYTRKRLNPLLPWSYIPHSRFSVYRALLEASVIHHNDLKAISVDRYEEATFRDALRSLDIRQSRILFPSFDLDEEQYQEKLFHFHRKAYESGMVSMTFTSMGHVAAPLCQAGVPCIRILASEESIRERIMQLKMSNMMAGSNHGKIAVMFVLFDYVFDQELDFRVREWEKIQYQNQCKEHIHSIAQRMEAAVFEEGVNCYYLVTDRNLFLNTFRTSDDYWKFLHFAQSSPEYMVWMGIGIGNTVLEAKSRASHALNQSRRDSTGSAYLVGETNDIQGPFRCFESHTQQDLSVSYLAHKLGIGTETLDSLKHAVARSEDRTFTSKNLAALLGITERSVNRILRRLDATGYITYVGKQSDGRGRPARIFRIEEF